MIGSGLKKLATEHGMKVAQGVAYGVYEGFAVTMYEGGGWKAVAFATRITDGNKLLEMEKQVNARDLKKEFRVLRLERNEKNIMVVFHDTIGTMKKIRAFLDWYVPILAAADATRADVCAECGLAMTGENWKLVNSVAYPMHEACAARLAQVSQEQFEQRKAEETGSYVTGAVGALLGALVGSILWAVVLYMGYVASVVGIVIGFLSKKGYELLRGKNGTPKIAIVILMSLLGVVAGTFLCDAMSLAVMIGNGELPGVALVDIPRLFELLFADADYVSATVKNILMGGFFALLGLIGVFSQMRQEANAGKVTVKELK